MLLELTHDRTKNLGCSDTTCCSCLGNNPIEESQLTERDAAGKYPKDKNNKQERKPTQYLMRFGNLPTSSGQGGEILLIQQPIQVFPRDFSGDTIHEGSTPIFIARESQGFRKPQLGSTPNQKRNLKLFRRTDSPIGRPDRSTDPVLRSTGRSTVTNRNH